MHLYINAQLYWCPKENQDYSKIMREHLLHIKSNIWKELLK